MKRWWMVKIAKITLVFLVSVTIISFLVMLLWNNLVPALFNGPSISFFQSLGLLLLLRMLSLSFHPWRYRGRQKGEHLRRKFEENIASMPDEQREKLKQFYASRCGGWYDDKKSTQKSASVNDFAELK